MLESPALSALRSVAAQGDTGSLSRGDWDHLQRLAADWQALPAPAYLVAMPAPLPAPRWHLEHLRSLAKNIGEGIEVDSARRRYHARSLGHLLLPDDPAFRPLVTMLIPVHDRAELAAEAVESCIRQTWRPLEILVIDDGSSDDLAHALQPYLPALRLHRKPHGGVSSARNIGIRLARGDFIHFLDSDDLLLPHAVASKVDAFLQVADAELCYTHAEDQALTAEPRIGGPRATKDLLAAVRSRHPFLIPTVMMPRWSMLDAPPFEEDLRRGEDSRYWFALGLRGTKAIEIAQPLTIRRKLGPSLNDLRFRSEEETVTVRARDLHDVLASPRHWRHAPGYYMRLAADARRYGPYNLVTGTAARAISRLHAALADLAGGGRRSGLSPLPLFAALRATDERWGARARAARLGEDLDAFLAALPAVLAEGLRTSPPLETADLQYWSDEAPREFEPHVGAAFRALRVSELQDAGGRAAVTWILRKVRLPLARPDAKRFRSFRRLMGSDGLAARLTWGLQRARQRR